MCVDENSEKIRVKKPTTLTQKCPKNNITY